MKAPPVPLWRMTRERVDHLVAAGIFGPEDRVELLGGSLSLGSRKAVGTPLPSRSCAREQGDGVQAPSWSNFEGFG